MAAKVWTRVSEKNPAKQGLKHGFVGELVVSGSVSEKNPAKQGLKRRRDRHYLAAGPLASVSEVSEKNPAEQGLKQLEFHSLYTDVPSLGEESSRTRIETLWTRYSTSGIPSLGEESSRTRIETPSLDPLSAKSGSSLGEESSRTRIETAAASPK